MFHVVHTFNNSRILLSHSLESNRKYQSQNVTHDEVTFLYCQFVNTLTIYSNIGRFSREKERVLSKLPIFWAMDRHHKNQNESSHAWHVRLFMIWWWEWERKGSKILVKKNAFVFLFARLFIAWVNWTCAIIASKMDCLSSECQGSTIWAVNVFMCVCFFSKKKIY